MIPTSTYGKTQNEKLFHREDAKFAKKSKRTKNNIFDTSSEFSFFFGFLRVFAVKRF